MGGFVVSRWRAYNVQLKLQIPWYEGLRIRG